MPQTVEITVADDGSVTVGLTDAPSAQAQQPAASLAAAFQMAKHLLASGSPGQPSDPASPVGSPSSLTPAASGSDAPGAPVGGVAGPSSSAGGAAEDPKAVWAQLAAKNNPVH